MKKARWVHAGGRNVLVYERVLPEFMSLLPAFLARRVVWRQESRSLYPNWEAAKAASAPYGDERLSAFRVARAATYEPTGAALAGTLLPLVARMLGKEGLAVTDFGGSCGELGAEFLNVFPRATYTVVENQTLVRLLQSSKSGVRFTAAMPAVCDLFYTSGTLQYLDDPLSVLEQGFRSARLCVVLARNSFCDQTLFRVQTSHLFDNGAGLLPDGFEDQIISYPNRTIVEADVMRLAVKSGFDCVARIEEQGGVLPFREQVYGKQLVFLRRLPGAGN